MCDGPDFFLCILSILFPPIGVWVKRGVCSADSLINIALCFLGYLPGLLHAWYIISLYPQPRYDPVPQDSEGRVTYYYVASRSGHSGQGGYGTLHHPTPAGGQFPGQQSGAVNDFAHQAPKYASQPQLNAQPAPQQQPQDPAAGSSSAGADHAPPSYDETVAGDHKVQSRD